METPQHMEALALEPAARRRFTRHRVDWPASLKLEGGTVLAGAARDYCVGGAYLALEPAAGVPASPGARGRLRLSPPGVAAADFTVEIRQSGSGGVGLMFLDVAESDSARLLIEATRPQTPAPASGPEASALRASLRSLLERNIQHWGPLWLAALKQRLFRVAAEAPSSLQHRLMDVHQALERGTQETLALMARQVLGRFDDPADRSGEAASTAHAGPADEQMLSLVDYEAFEDFLAEADLASRVEAVHRSLLYRLNAMLVAALGESFDTAEGPLSPRALVRGLWLAVQGRTAEVAVRQMAQSLFNEMFVSRLGEFYADCARRLVEAGFEGEAVIKPVTAVKRRSVPGPEAEPASGQAPAGEASTASAILPVSLPGPSHPALGPPVAPGLPRLSGLQDPQGAGHAAGASPDFWPAAGADPRAFERTQGQPGRYAPGVGWAAGAAPAFIGQTQAEALARFYARVGAAGQGTPEHRPGPATSPSLPEHARAAPGHAGGVYAGWPDAGIAEVDPFPPLGHPQAQVVALSDADAPLLPYTQLPRPAQAVAGDFVNDLLTGLSADPRVGAAQSAALVTLRTAIEGAVAHSPAALTDPTHPVRRVATALSRLVWVEGEQAIGPCGLGVEELLERLSQPGQASHAMFMEVARELEAMVVTQRAFVAHASEDLVARHAEQHAIVQSRRRPEEVHGVLAEQLPKALAPWVSRARALQVGDEVVQRRPKQADLLLRLVWVGDEQRQFAFTDAAARHLHSMTLQELAMQLMRGRIVPAMATEEPVAQALLAMVDAADARLQSAAAVHRDSGLLSEVGLLGELDGLTATRTREGAPAEAQLARWRARGDVPPRWDEVVEILQGGLPEGTRLGVLEGGDLLACAPPGACANPAWTAAVRAVSEHLEASLPALEVMAAARRFRPGEEQPQEVLARLALALGGGDPDLYLSPGPEELRAALVGHGSYSLVSDLTPLRASEGGLASSVAVALVPRLLEGVAVNIAVVNADASLAHAWDRWMIEQVIERAQAEGDAVQTPWYVPVSDLALTDATFVDHVGRRLLETGVTPARLMLELGLTRADQHEALLNNVAGLKAYGCAVALRYRHGTGLTATLLRRAGIGCLHLPDWLTESGHPSTERSLLLQSLVDLCRFIDIPSLAIVPPGEAASADLREIGVDWMQQADEGNDGTVRLTRREGPTPAP